jgi:NADH-quinone oxidoreductase subunit L
MLISIVLFPLLGAVVNGLIFATGFWKKVLGASEHTERKIVSAVGCGVILASALLSSIMLYRLLGLEPESRRVTEVVFTWISSGGFASRFDFFFDPVSAVMALVVTWISFFIHLYSIGYMHGDRGYARYFTYLNLFVFFMLVLVLGGNFVLMFAGWEGVGLASYLLIGFWYEDPLKAYAGKKAFIVNRIGDFGFIIGIFLIFYVFGSVNYGEVFSRALDPTLASSIPDWVITAIALLLFLGAVGKSAQFPLYVWLPDAMAGPTPVSALIHAATMVTAGVYMITRCNVFYSLAPHAQTVVVSIAAFTAFFAATIAITQNDIKKVLAYSTVSQLGYMFMGVGCGAFAAGMFHLVTHAFFKALLFLGSGSVIHALGGEQDIRKMGALRKHLPFTSTTFLIGTLAISGLPLLSGFFSKDEILSSLYNRGFSGAWLLGLLTAVLTAFYMMRLYLLTFEGNSRVGEETKLKLHESPGVMLLPLGVLAFLSIVGGYIGVPEFMGRVLGVENSNLFERFLSTSLYTVAELHGKAHLLGHWTLVLLSVVAALLGLAFAYFVYIVRPGTADAVGKNPIIKPLYAGSFAKWYVDEVYDALIVRPFGMLSRLAYAFDGGVIDGIVNGVGYSVRGLGTIVRIAQNGLIRAYATLIAIGTVAIIIYMIARSL